MEKKFSKIEIAVIKRTAQNVSQFVTKKERIDAKIAELEAEKAALQPIIDSFQGPIREMTGGYSTEDLVIRETVHTGKVDAKTGKEILQTRFVLKYPETVIPAVPPTTEGLPGSDYDLDKENTVSETPSEDVPEELLAENAAAQQEAESHIDFFADSNSWQ